VRIGRVGWMVLSLGAFVLLWAAAAWLVERWQLGKWPRFRSAHTGLALYLVFACLSLLLAAPSLREGVPKLLGVAELCTLAFITSDLASRPDIRPAIARTIAATSLVTFVAAIAGRPRKTA